MKTRAMVTGVLAAFFLTNASMIIAQETTVANGVAVSNGVDEKRENLRTAKNVREAPSVGVKRTNFKRTY